MKEFILDGRFLSQPKAGVQRYSEEVLRRFAEMEDVHVVVAMPKDGGAHPIESKNIEYVLVGKNVGTKWEQRDLVKFCKQRKLPLLCTANAAPVTFHSYVLIHDVLWLDMKEYAAKWSWNLKTKLMLRSIVRKQDQVFTVSEFSAERIMARAKKLKKRPIVLGAGYEHVLRLQAEPIENLPQKFFLSVGSVYPHKNFGYMLRLAKNNPDRAFVIAGKKYTDFETEISKNKLENLFFTDYITDGQLKWLYERCEGFILPSLYEGFGLPPLEAVACGCRKIFLSDIPVFREVYGNCATFFDPKDYEHPVSLDAENMTEEAANSILEKYTWKRVAETIIEAILST